MSELNREELLIGLIENLLLPEEEAQLAHLLKEDSAFLALAARVYTIHQMLRSKAEARTLADRIAACLRTRENGTAGESRQLADAVVQRLRARREDALSWNVWGRRALTAAAALLAAAGIWWGISRPPAVQWQVAAGECRVAHGKGTARTATAGANIRAGERVVTAPEGYAELTLQDGSTVELNAGTEVLLHRIGKSTELTLEQGDVYVQASRPIRFNPGRYDQVENLGTVFELSRTKEGQTTVRVAQGQVQFGSGATKVAVHGLQASHVVDGGLPSGPEATSMAGIGAWSKAFAPGWIYSDNFDADRLADFWTTIHPRDRVALKDGMLSLSAEPPQKDTSGPNRTEMISKAVRLGGRPVEVVLERNKMDGAWAFLPMGGELTASAELTDEAGRTICRATWKTYWLAKDRPLTGCYATIGTKDHGNVATSSSPVALRILLHPDGRIALGQGTPETGGMTLLTEGHAGKPIREIALRLCLANRGTEPVTARFLSMEARRLAAWPDWVNNPAQCEDAR